nr:hypothetical protein [Tanacetum cinerariifolium]
MLCGLIVKGYGKFLRISHIAPKRQPNPLSLSINRGGIPRHSLLIPSLSIPTPCKSLLCNRDLRSSNFFDSWVWAIRGTLVWILASKSDQGGPRVRNPIFSKMSSENGVNPPAPNPSHNSSFSLLSVLGRERLTGLNYMDWIRNLRFTLRYENKAHVLAIGHNAKKRKSSHSNWKGKAARGKSDRGSKRKNESEIAPTSDPKEAVCFYCNKKGHWKRSCTKYLKDLKDAKVEKGSHSGSKGK